MTLFRRGRASLTDAEAQLDEVAREAAALRAQLDGLQAQQDLAEAFEAHYAHAAAMLSRLRDELADIEAADDWTRKREVVELLVAGIRVTTEGDGRGKQASVALGYTFTPSRAVASATD